MVYIMPRNRARSLVQASSITPPLRGSRREGGARSRAGGGGTRRPVSDDQRHYRRQGGGNWLPPPHRISLRLAARLLRLPLEGGVIPAVQTGDVVYTLDREHGLHHAKESGKKPCAGLKHHSPLEGESARGRSPQSSRWGGTRRPVSDDQRHYRRQGGGNWLAPPPHQPSPDGSASATPPQGGSDTRGANWGRRLHIGPGTWFTSCQGIGQEALCRPQASLPP